MTRLFLALGLLVLASGCDSGPDAFGPPRSAEILRVTVTAAPLADVDGDGWDGDAGGGPEVYFRLFDDVVDYETRPGDDLLNPRDDGDIVFALGSTDPWFNDVDVVDLPLVWDVDPGLFIRDLGDPFYVALFDYDPFDGDDPIGYTETFTLADFAPSRVSNQATIIRLRGFDLRGTAIDEVDVSLTVQFLD